MAFHDLKDVTWTPRKIGGTWNVNVPSFMSIHGLENWEVERFTSMSSRLKRGMTFVDIGAYDGWQDAVISGFVGGAQNMILVEPEPTNWGNIKATFESNGLGTPDCTFMGLIGQEPTGGEPVNFLGWPKSPNYNTLISHTTFRHIDENMHNTSCISLDTLCGFPVSRKVNALNVDVEGAGLLVLQSGEKTIREQHPLIWVSIHGREIFHHRPIAQGFPPEQLIPEFLEGLGYKGTLLANDHEEEWFFEYR